MNVELIGITKKYGDKVIFEDLNIKFERGKLTVVFGKSGCGKTTLLNIAGLLENKFNGKVLYDNLIIDNSIKKRKLLKDKIGFVFQDFGLVENFNVLQNILIIDSIKRNPNRINLIDEVLRSLDLEFILNKKIHELSGGEQQRVSLAKLILKNPEVILVDEPTSSLDRENKLLVLYKLKQMAKEGKTVIVVSHDTEIISLADVKINLQDIALIK